MDIKSTIAELLFEGNCCTEAIIKAGLLLRGEENQSLISAARGLCGGMFAGCNCGALTGGALFLSMFDPDQAKRKWIPTLITWFTEQYGEPYGSIDCRDIAGNEREYKALRCPDLIASVGEKCYSLLQEAGRL